MLAERHCNDGHKAIILFINSVSFALQLPRGNGCVITWSVKMDKRFKWLCTCLDKCTGLTEAQTKQSRDGALEHCLEKLFQKLARKEEL